MKRLFIYVVGALVDWIVRRRSPALYVVRAGLLLQLAVLAGWALQFSIPTADGALSFRFDTGTGTPAAITYALTILSIGLILAGIIWEIYRYRNELVRLARKKVIVVEVRGLRDTGGAPLLGAVPSNLEGQREQILIDLRQGVRDGVIVAPETAIERLASLPFDLKSREGGLDRRDIRLIYGGMTPVPLTFLTGVLLDDESDISFMDWDRHTQKWRPLDANDDKKRFVISGMDAVSAGSEISLAVSVSYRVDAEAVSRQFAKRPLVHMELEGGSPDCHWSEEKQNELGRQFLNIVIALSNKGVTRIHLFIAAQNSVVFRFGRLYDKRNLPPISVYQYERGAIHPYPWAILMPVAGLGAVLIKGFP